MQIELVSVGTELLLGEIVDSNAVYLAEKLSGLGVNVYHKTTVGDNVDRLVAALQISLGRADGVLATGGLGPTEDDITAAAIARAMGVPLVEDEGAVEHIRSLVRRRGLSLLDSLLKQARIPVGATVVPNPVGTAPGFILEKEGKTVIALPGPPVEMQPMAEATVLPYLAEKTAQQGRSTLVSRVLRFGGIGESQIEARLSDLIAAQTNPTMAPLAKVGEVHLRLTARAPSREEGLAMIAPVEAQVRERLGDHIYGVDGETLEALVGAKLRESGQTLAVAESCTGGLIGHRLTNVPGSSEYLLASLVTYSNRAKIGILGVPAETIEQHGAVSEETARAMAEGARRACGADIGLSVTGIAGPSGATESKPVGLTHFGLADGEQMWSREARLGGDRLLIKERAAQSALYLLWRHLTRGLEEGA